MLTAICASLTVITPICGAIVRKHALSSIIHLGPSVVKHTMHKPASFGNNMLVTSTGPIFVMNHIPEQNEFTITNDQKEQYKVFEYVGVLDKEIPVWMTDSYIVRIASDDEAKLKNGIRDKILGNTLGSTICFGLITWMLY